MNARKKLAAAYKEREVIGGVYAIKNTQSGRRLVECTTDMRGSVNRFGFTQKNNLCPNKKIEDDWKKSGASSFVFEVVEELTKGASQTIEEFQSDVAVLRELWLQKFSEENLM
jgi:hypothetical protein